MLVRGEQLSRLTAELRHRERLLERLFDRIIEERRDERKRIATGLHDDVLQSLIRGSQLASFLSKELPPDSQASQDAAELATLSATTIEALRTVLSDLQRSPVGRGGLLSALRTLADDLELVWRRRIVLHTSAELDVSPESQVVGYQAAREAIVNALKHSEGSRIEIRARREADYLLLVVADNGQGFDPDMVDESVQFGLGLMRTRVRLAGGTVDLRSGRDRGTEVIIKLPAAERLTGEEVGPGRQTGRVAFSQPAPPS
jgi:signal transduction histidine kinase